MHFGYIEDLLSDPRSTLIFLLLALPGRLLAISCHEAAHAYVANRCGDPTARLMGRMTLNPFKHLVSHGRSDDASAGHRLGEARSGQPSEFPRIPQGRSEGRARGHRDEHLSVLSGLSRAVRVHGAGAFENSVPRDVLAGEGRRVPLESTTAFPQSSSRAKAAIVIRLPIW